MALYIVVHHRSDQSQPWCNAWIDDNQIQAIQTTVEIGQMCERAMRNGGRIFVHRCGWGECAPAICCSAKVESVDAIDRRTTLVIFDDPVTLNDQPTFAPGRGQNCYTQ